MRTLFKDVTELAKAFAERKVTEGHIRENRVFVERDTIYSYGHHFPIARFTGADKAEVNCRRYSPTTSRQQNMVKFALHCAGVDYVEVIL